MERKNFQSGIEKISLVNTKRISPMKGKHHSKESKDRISTANKISIRNSERFQEYVKSRVGKKFSEGRKNNIGFAIRNSELFKEYNKRRVGKPSGMKGKFHTEEAKINIGLSNIGKKHGMKGMHHSIEAKQKIILAGRKRKFSDETKKKLSLITEKLWQNPEFIDKQIKACNRRPTSLEKEFDLILKQNFPGKYKYVGNCQFVLGGKCPDFMNVDGQKKLIEVYGTYWHKGQNTKARIDHFKKFGFDTLVVWDHELKNKAELLDKITKFEEV